MGSHIGQFLPQTSYSLVCIECSWRRHTYIHFILIIHGIESEILVTNFSAEWAYSGDWNKLINSIIPLGSQDGQGTDKSSLLLESHLPKCPRKVST